MDGRSYHRTIELYAIFKACGDTQICKLELQNRVSFLINFDRLSAQGESKGIFKWLMQINCNIPGINPDWVYYNASNVFFYY